MVKNLESSTTSGDLGRLTMAGLDKDVRQDLGGVAATEKQQGIDLGIVGKRNRMGGAFYRIL